MVMETSCPAGAAHFLLVRCFLLPALGTDATILHFINHDICSPPVVFYAYGDPMNNAVIAAMA